MPKLITFDGRSGSGKTTQVELIREEIRRRTGEMPYARSTAQSLDPTLNFLRWMGDYHLPGFNDRTIALLKSLMMNRIRQREQDLCNKEGFVVADWFWDGILNYGINDKLLDAYRTIISEESGFEPIVSFCLIVPTGIRKDRLVIRDGHAKRWTHGEMDSDRDARDEQTAKWLETKVPYVHTIDGTLSEEVIRQRIISVMNRSNLIT